MTDAALSVATDTKTPEKTNCVACDSEIPGDADTCSICTFKQTPTFCVNCKKRIPVSAKLCSVCKTYQRWWRFLSEFTTALPAVALAAMVSGVWTAGTYLYDRNSHTNFKFISANANVVYLTVWNTGQKPSALLGGRLSFGGLPIDDVALLLPDIDVRQAKTVIHKDDRALIALNVSPFLGLHNGKYAYTKQEVNDKLKSQKVTLYLYVNESDGETVAPSDVVTVNRLQEFIMKGMYK